MIQPANRAEFLEHMPIGGNVAEVGVFKGHFSQLILDVTRPDRLFLVDSWEADSQRQVFGRRYWQVAKRFLHDPRVYVLRMDSVEAAGLFPDGFFSWIYVDANHDEEAVRSDLEAFRDKVAVNGFYAGHDYQKESVRRAVDGFVADRGLKVDVLSKGGKRKREKNWPSYAIRKRERS